MQSRNVLIALTVLSSAAVVAMPARAASPFSTSRFSITYPDGWSNVPIGVSSDSILAVINMQTMAYAYMTASITDHPLTAQELEAYRQAYGGADSATKVSDGTKTLGGKSFTFVEYQSTDTSNGDSRARIYYTSSGANLFTTVLIYDPSAGSGAVTDVETALATLSLKSTAIHAVAARTQGVWSPADHDILGRSRLLTARTALFRLPTR